MEIRANIEMLVVTLRYMTELVIRTFRLNERHPFGLIL